MRNFALAAFASMAIATPALADDESWTGGYGGISAGYNIARSDSTVALGGQWAAEPQALRDLVTNNFSVRQQTKNGDFGAYLGYLYQTGGFVIGAEVEAAAIGGRAIRSTGTVAYTATQNYTFTNTIDPKNMIAVKARLGGAVGSNTLLYLNAGWAWVGANHSAGVTGAIGLLANGNYKKLGESNKTHDGFLIGAGVEQRLDSHFSIRAQYEYTDQGDIAYTTAYLPNSLLTTPAYTETVNQDLRLHLIRVGITYRF